jgi:hypothetical protein
VAEQVERRFALEFREADRDEPGLVLEDDGTIWLVSPGGSRALLGTGGVVFDGGTVHHTITVDPAGADEPSLQIGESTEPPNDAAHAQVFTDPADGLLKVKLRDNSVVVVGNGGSQPNAILVEEITFAEDETHDTFVGTITLPANARLIQLFYETTVAYDGGVAEIVIADETDTIAHDSGIELPESVRFAWEWDYGGNWGTNTGGSGKVYPSGQTITATLTTAPGIGTTSGRTNVLVYYVVPNSTPATPAGP